MQFSINERPGGALENKRRMSYIQTPTSRELHGSHFTRKNQQSFNYFSLPPPLIQRWQQSSWFTDLSQGIRKLHTGVSKQSVGNFESSLDVSSHSSRTLQGQREQAASAGNQSSADGQGPTWAVTLQAHPSIKKSSCIPWQSLSFISLFMPN